jgi:hypothetical protein
MTDLRAVAVLVVVFLAGSIYPVLREQPYCEFSTVEIIQIRKMLDYGFVQTRGVVPHNMHTIGRLAHPEKVNYTHHPLPRNWLYAGIYVLSGGFGVLLSNVGLV